MEKLGLCWPKIGNFAPFLGEKGFTNDKDPHFVVATGHAITQSWLWGYTTKIIHF